jgi:molecular chaperone GrpE
MVENEKKQACDGAKEEAAAPREQNEAKAVKSAEPEEKKEKKTREPKPEDEAQKAEIDKLKAENKRLGEEAERLKAELAEKKDVCLRLAAEYDNFRKRTSKEKDQIFGDAYSCAVNAFLPVFDNIERAILAPEGEGMKKGLELVIRQLSEIMEKQNIKPINPVGEPFNPELHNAVMHVKDETLGENVVAEVLQKGYMIGDKVIRHAMVKVAN